MYLHHYCAQLPGESVYSDGKENAKVCRLVLQQHLRKIIIIKKIIRKLQGSEKTQRCAGLKGATGFTEPRKTENETIHRIKFHYSLKKYPLTSPTSGKTPCCVQTPRQTDSGPVVQMGRCVTSCKTQLHSCICSSGARWQTAR